MKYSLLTLFTFFLLVFGIQIRGVSQTVEITPTYGYQFGSKLNYNGGYFKLNDGNEFGITVGFNTYKGLLAELTYIRHESDLRFRDVVFSPNETNVSNINFDWIMVGASQYFKTGRVKPYAGGALGVVIITPQDQNFGDTNIYLDTNTKFAFSFKAGVKIMLTEVLGLNLQGNLMFPVDWGGYYVGVGPGGVGGGASVNSTTLIGGFSGGLVFAFGD
ncbi:MAG: hypothetical protein BM564_12290 [Bacteroidetes bacterium MedPE-SWsnd-G2]|nr:MAG: hypothetical protein BM564_12290 [Bacteroidetes bacterium MedPE-SWsnd-G2]